MRRRSPLLLFCLLAVAVAARPSAQRPEVRVEQVGWMAGCWETSSPQRTVEEQWTAPRGQTMLGTGRTVRDGRTTEYEFVVISVKDGRLAYEAHPSGQPSAVFLSSELSDTRVIFQNSDHDFPQRVAYERQSADALLAWIEGSQNGRTRRVEFPYRRVPCH
jgi:hypothetical protein